MLPLYLVEALLIEVVAARGRRTSRRAARFGIISGVLVGTVGFAAEWGWSHLVMPIPWTDDILPEGVIMALVAGIAGGMLGGLLGAGLRSELPSRRGCPHGLRRLAAALVVAVIAQRAHRREAQDTEAAISVTETRHPVEPA